MVTQIASETSAKTYELTINEQGIVTGCQCASRYYRPAKNCKHMNLGQAALNAEIARAALFLAMKSRIAGLEETARINRAMAFDPMFQ